MSFRSESSQRWQKVRRIPGRVPLRIKLITAVLALVMIALVAISVVGISVLRGYLLGQADNELTALEGPAQHAVAKCLDGSGPCPTHSSGVALYWLPTNGPPQSVWVPARPPAGVLSRPTAVPGPAMHDSQGWLDSISGKPVTVRAQTGGGHWRGIAPCGPGSNNREGGVSRDPRPRWRA